MSKKQMEQIAQALQSGSAKTVRELIRQALDQNISATRILNEGLLQGLRAVSDHYKTKDAFVTDVLVAARAFAAGSALIEPKLVAENYRQIGTVVIGTVHGDLHDIGKNLVAMMLKSQGFEVIDLGVDVPPERFVEAIRAHSPQLVCCSALLTSTMNEIRQVVSAIQGAGLRDQVKIMIGGGPISERFCQQVGADIYEPDAISAAETAVQIVQG